MADDRGRRQARHASKLSAPSPRRRNESGPIVLPNESSARGKMPMQPVIDRSQRSFLPPGDRPVSHNMPPFL